MQCEQEQVLHCVTECIIFRSVLLMREKDPQKQCLQQVQTEALFSAFSAVLRFSIWNIRNMSSETNAYYDIALNSQSKYPLHSIPGESLVCSEHHVSQVSGALAPKASANN